MLDKVPFQFSSDVAAIIKLNYEFRILVSAYCFIQVVPSTEITAIILLNCILIFHLKYESKTAFYGLVVDCLLRQAKTLITVSSIVSPADKIVQGAN